MDSPTTRTSLPSRPAPAATGLSSPCRVPNRASVDALQPRKTPSSAVDSGRQNGGKSPARSRQKTVTTAPRELASPAAGRAEGTGSIRQSESRRGRNASLEASVSSGVSVRPASGSNPARHSSEDAGSSKRSYLRKAASGIASAPREVCTLATVAQKSPSQSARTSGSHVQAADARKRVLVAGATGYVGR